MAETLIERVWAWLHATFPERQIYIRSDGRVQFFTFSPTLQATLAGLSLIFLGWVAFASVNVIFKDRIIAAKDHRYQQMQSTYEDRLADIQVSYDELNGALVSAEDTFKATADKLEVKQRTVAGLLDRKNAVDQTLAGLRGSSASQRTSIDGILAAPASNTASDGISGQAPIGGDGSDLGGSSDIGAMPNTAQPQPRTANPTKASFLDEAVGRLAAALFPKKVRPPAAKILNQPAFRLLATQTARLQQMSHSETALLVAADHQVSGSIDEIEAVMRRVGVSPDRMEQEEESKVGGVGGPFIPISAMRIDGIADTAFTNAFAEASAHVKELDALFSAFRHIPLTTPVHGGEFELTSDFGPRIDPFTHRLGFHPGLDFGGPWGAVIHSTAPGVVDWAGWRGGYGNMVEIDHGFGIKTRYGHMSSILVKVGAKVQKGTPLGKLGSTGRSTGPHVHYEVWLGDVVRDPSRFIEAGRHVLK
ncbi:MAG: M23 family metallopeptidase [Alphaproteobacteria bacterium]|nr:M23 family metallopeptidase [Alphaproteobacteria bacterium]MDE2011340.1 M23 family metallopeptidase [Alphaproteobacteria bacterium]MDE2074084.1 M23 family metallopeptidase [Alphaproteobacteria bacterium]MDE2350247.1 M23 family metallopeptidase [Alphaproteobacteria bacterium]